MFGTAVPGKARAGVVMVDHGEGKGEVRLGDLLEGAQFARKGQALPAVLLRQLDPVEPRGAARHDRLQGIAPLPLPARGVGGNVFRGESRGPRNDGHFFGRQKFIQHAPEIHDWTRGATAG